MVTFNMRGNIKDALWGALVEAFGSISRNFMTQCLYDSMTQCLYDSMPSHLQYLNPKGGTSTGQGDDTTVTRTPLPSWAVCVFLCA